MSDRMKMRLALSWLLLVLGAAVACSKQGQPENPKQATTGLASEFDWYMEGTTPAGTTTLTRSGDGQIQNVSDLHWNNREYTLASELRLDDSGFVTYHRLSGESAFGARIDETFTYRGGAAAWRTPGEAGSAATTEPAFYVPNEGFELASLEALVRVAADALNGEVALLPAGTARVEKVLDRVVAAPSGPVGLSLYAIVGTALTPVYAWFDNDLRIAAYDSAGWMGMLPRGWSPQILATLSEAQSEADAAFFARLSEDLTVKTERPVVFEHVAVVDVRQGTVLENRYVQVDDGTITKVSKRPLDAANALRIDGRNRYLMPGLWDMHGHFSLSDGILNIAGGFTSVRDIGGVHEKVVEMSERFDSGQVIGPTTYRAGFIDKAGPFASGGVAATLDDALEMVYFFSENGYIQVKLYSSIEPDWVKPIAERAHALGMRVSGHVPAFMSAEQAVRAGYDEIQHINMVFLNFLAADREDTRTQLRFTLYGDEARKLDLGSEEVLAFFELLESNDVVVDATAAIFETMLIHAPGEPDPTFAAVIDHLPVSTRRPMYNPEMDTTGHAAAWRESARRQSEMLKALHDYGIQIVPGSDHMAAFTLHRELEVYVEAGIPVADVLRMATHDSARVAGVESRVGSIDPGKDADLLLLGENPLEDISAVRRSLLVMKGRDLYRPDELYRAIGVRPFVESADVN